ncbi:hypothetical protein [Cellulomonas sp. P5_C6]
MRFRALGAALLTAALVLLPTAAHAAGSDDPTPYTVTATGLQLPAGTTFEENGHINYKVTQLDGGGEKSFNVHQAVPHNNQWPQARYVGQSYYPWTDHPQFAASFPGGYCITWVQVSLYNEHFGEGGQAPVCTPTDPVVPTDPTDPVTPVDPTDPTDPVTPVDPTDPTDPVTPVDPTDPTDPVTPVDPTDPTDPVTPVDPTDPVTPVDPTDPVTPVDPTDPTSPLTPVDPTDPLTPVDPTDPINPTDPLTPTDPVITPTDPTDAVLPDATEPELISEVLAAEPSDAAELASTGFPVAAVGALGALAIVGGAALLVVARRRTGSLQDR